MEDHINESCSICLEHLVRSGKTPKQFMRTLTGHRNIPNLNTSLKKLGFNYDPAENHAQDSEQRQVTDALSRLKKLFKNRDCPRWAKKLVRDFKTVVQSACCHKFHLWCLQHWTFTCDLNDRPHTCPLCRRVYHGYYFVNIQTPYHDAMAFVQQMERNLSKYVRYIGGLTQIETERLSNADIVVRATFLFERVCRLKGIDVALVISKQEGSSLAENLLSMPGNVDESFLNLFGYWPDLISILKRNIRAIFDICLPVGLFGLFIYVFPQILEAKHRTDKDVIEDEDVGTDVYLGWEFVHWFVGLSLICAVFDWLDICSYFEEPEELDDYLWNGQYSIDDNGDESDGDGDD